MRETVSPVALADGCGITLLRDRNGEILLLAVDYSDYDEADSGKTRESTVMFRLGDIEDVEAIYGEKPRILRSDGTVRGISLKLHQQECVLLRLVRP